MDERISYKMCAVKVRNAKLRNYLNATVRKTKFVTEDGNPKGMVKFLKGGEFPKGGRIS
jgi:hypothetical protein